MQHRGSLPVLPLDDTARRSRQQCLVVPLTHTDVPTPHRKGGSARGCTFRQFGARVDGLPDGDDVPGIAPGGIGGDEECPLKDDLALGVGQ